MPVKRLAPSVCAIALATGLMACSGEGAPRADKPCAERQRAAKSAWPWQRQADPGARDAADLCRYSKDNARLIAGPPAGRQIVFMGDSITEDWARVHPEFFAPGMVNRGIGGQTTSQMLIRFHADVIALRPEAVHIMAGTNDIAGNPGSAGPQGYRDNIEAMVDMAGANGIRVILASIPPALAFPWNPGARPAPQISEQNAWLRDYARRKGLTYIDYWSLLAAPDGAFRSALARDGVHPNRAGYAAIEPLARDAMKRVGLE